MKCVVPSHNVKVLAKAFLSLGKIGDDLFIEPHTTHIAFRTVNSAESAYAFFTFSRSFFASFTSDENDNEDALRCKISMKSLQEVFKNKHGEKLLEWCQIRLDSNSTKVVFQLRYSYGCTKTHLLPILESETLQANYSKEDNQNRLSARPKLLSAAVNNFRPNKEVEVTLCISNQKIILRNYLENDLDSKKSVKTEISLYPGEFESFNIGVPSSVTFCLKELRAVLFFAEFTGLPIDLYISTAGKPVVFVVKNDTVYEANYVVSTLSEAGTSQTLSQVSESSAATSSRANVPTSGKKRPFNQVEPSQPHIPLSAVARQHNSEFSTTLPLNNSVAANSQFSQAMDISKSSNATLPVVKNVFGVCFNSTFKKQNIPGYEKVLAYDSDGLEDSD